MLPGTVGGFQGVVHLLSRPERRLQLLALVAGLGVVTGVTAILLLGADSSDLEYWRALGYPGVLIFSFLGAASVFLPMPGLVAVCGAGGLEMIPIVVGLLSGIGETTGELTGYAVGYGGRTVVEGRRSYERVSGWMARRGTVVLFLVSVIPNPFFDVVGIVAGSTRFPMARFLATVWIGKSLKGLMVTYTCFYGVKLLPWVS